MDLEHVKFTGVFRRLIDLKAWDSSTVVGWLEDDYHHFGITLTHDGSVITGLRSAEPRHPWTGCADAGRPLRDLVGKPLLDRCSDIGKLIDMRLQCTHLFDLAGLLMAHACHGRDHRRYEATVSALDSPAGEEPQDWFRARLWRDGVETIEWDLLGKVIMKPEAIAGRSINEGFREWSETMDEAEAEPVVVLRRAVFVSRGRTFHFNRAMAADETKAGNVCHNFQPEKRKASVRILESGRRFDRSPGDMLSLVGMKP